MMYSTLGSMAWRNLWRNRRRTLLTLSSIAFGTMLAILFTGLGDSNWRQMIDLAARLGAGHVTIQHVEYLDAPTLSRTVPDAAAVTRIALADPDVLRVVPRISGFLMLATAGQSYGAGFLALDPSVEDETTFSLLEAVSEGDMFESPDDPGVILGSKLAKNLDVTLGQKVVFTLTDRQGEIVRGASRVRAIMHTGAPTVDGALSVFAIGTLRESLGYGPDEVGQVGVFLSDQRQSNAVAVRLAGAIDGAGTALPWYQNNPDLAAFIAMKVAGAQFMEIVIALLIAAGIFNTLFVSVMERVREFGIMLAIGFRPSRLFGLVMFESLWLGLVGLVGAALVTAGPYYYLATTGIDISAQIDISNSEIAGVAMTPLMTVSIYPENLAMIATAVLIATLLSGLYPAWKAGRVEPVESIRLV
jgi:ABC-type lipoprotein release transport system permease subunit